MVIDGFVASVPASEKASYVDYTNRIDALFLEYGATRVVDGWGHDVPHGNVTDFYRAVAATQGETVVFGYIEWPDTETRTRGWDAVMKDERMNDQQPPFDSKRMIFGAFEAICIKKK